MPTHMVRYTVKPESAAENEQLVRAVLDELRDVRPDGFRYAALKLDDGVTFVHLISHDGESAHLPGRQLDALRAFHAGLRERCAQDAVRTEAELIGAFGFRDDA